MISTPEFVINVLETLVVITVKIVRIGTLVMLPNSAKFAYVTDAVQTLVIKLTDFAIAKTTLPVNIVIVAKTVIGTSQPLVKKRLEFQVVNSVNAFSVPQV